MPKSRKRVRSQVRNNSTQKATITYTYDEEMEAWFAVIISHGKLLSTIDGETLGELLEEVESLISLLNLKNADHLVDRLRTPADKQREAVEFLQSKLF